MLSRVASTLELVPFVRRTGASGSPRWASLASGTITSRPSGESIVDIDRRFQQAVAFIGSGAVPALGRLFTDHPELARERLTTAGPWLRDKLGDALDGFFKDPYLLWFVSEDVPVHGHLP